MTVTNRKLAIVFTALSACDPEIENGDDSESLRHEVGIEDAVVFANDLEVVYELRRVRDADQNVVRTSEFGRLDLETWQKVARPSAHLDDEFIYIEEAGTNSTADGGSEQVYRVRRIPNVAPPVPEYEAPDPAEIITPKLSEVLAELDDAGTVRVMLKLPNYPDSNLPLLPEVSAVSVEDYLAAQAARDAAIEDRKARFERLSADLVTTIEKAGGEVVDGYWLVGWINADLSKAAIQSLSRSSLVSRMHPDDLGGKEAGMPVGTGRGRIATDTQTFWDNGYYGEDPDTEIPIHVAIQEMTGVEDEACFWDDDTGCDPERLLNRFRCSGAGCSWVSAANYDVDFVPHGTAVSAVLAGDYTQNQADGFNVCDSINTVHDMTFEARASGYAKEAVVSYFDHLNSADISRFVDSTECLMGIGAGCVNVDIVNNSTGWGPFCDADSSSVLEDAVEEAFDDGKFLVYPAGNEGSQGSCNIISPSDTPKVFTVNGLDVTSTAYASAAIDTSGDCEGLDCAARGGGTVESPNGTTRVGALSMVALAAVSNGISYTTYNDATENGCVITTAIPGGTSLASPAVAGMAAVLKSFHLDVGDTWVSSPGRLFAMMLAMGDREDAGGGTNTTGADNLFGLGRAKLRLMLGFAPSSTPGGYWMTTYTLTSGGAASYVFNTFGDAVVPTGAAEVKCVSFAQEDMSSKDNISDIDLEVRLRGLNGSGVCAEGEGTLYSTRTDTSWDNKKMVAFEDAGTNVEGRCVEVTLDRNSMSSSGSVVVNTFCMYTSEVDDEPSI